MGIGGGILLGVRTDTMEVLEVTEGNFHIKMHIHNKSDAVYGPAQEASKTSFLIELVNLAKDNPHPFIIGGDFNLLRFPFEKSKGRFDNRWPLLFNAVIDSLDLREITMVGR